MNCISQFVSLGGPQYIETLSVNFGLSFTILYSRVSNHKYFFSYINTTNSVHMSYICGPHLTHCFPKTFGNTESASCIACVPLMLIWLSLKQKCRNSTTTKFNNTNGVAYRYLQFTLPYKTTIDYYKLQAKHVGLFALFTVVKYRL